MPFASESFYKRAESGFRGEQLTSRNRIRLEQLKVTFLGARNFALYSQEPATELYYASDECSTRPQTILF
jgi:hypothetical protein